MATHSRTLSWKISWTKEPGGLQSMSTKSWATVHVQKEWATVHVHQELDMTEQLHFLSFFLSFFLIVLGRIGIFSVCSFPIHEYGIFIY